MPEHGRGDARGVARRPPRAARAREGAHPPERRAGGAAAGAALGPRRQGLRVRHRGRPADARGAVRRALAAARLPLHVRPRLGRGLPELLVDRRRVRPRDRAPRAARRDDGLRVARAGREAGGVQRRMGWAFPWASSCAATSTSTSGSRSRRSSSATAPSTTSAGVEQPPDELPGLSAFVLEDGVVYHTYSAYARGARHHRQRLPAARPRAEGPRRGRRGRLGAAARRVPGGLGAGGAMPAPRRARRAAGRARR